MRRLLNMTFRIAGQLYAVRENKYYAEHGGLGPGALQFRYHAWRMARDALGHMTGAYIGRGNDAQYVCNLCVDDASDK